MSSVSKHYDKVLAEVYSWMFGGYENGIRRNVEFIEKHHLKPCGSGIAVDLGAGCGFQSIPLARAGYSVTAIDIDGKLLNELKNHCGELSINIIQGDLINFDARITDKIELIVCMTDTINHLESKQKVTSLFNKVYEALEPGGKFVITFRDLTYELTGLDRFMPVKSDENTILTCFLEYEPETVKVHDIVYRKSNDSWELFKSFYRKLRLSRDWVTEQLLNSGFEKIDISVENGLVTVITAR